MGTTVIAFGAGSASTPAVAAANVLTVCNGSTTACPAGTRFATIQQAVDAAAPGDWVLVWPGVYHEKGTAEQGVLITTAGIHLRGLDRNRVIVDGSNGTAAQPCPTAAALQDFTPRNGIEVLKADGVYIENLTVCNYLSSPSGDHGNQIWWNGGDGSAQLGMSTWWGNYISATSQYGGDSGPMGMYGIFVSNASGPGSVDHAYASNMGDSAYYVGACRQVCHAVLNHVQAENSALGFSGTNAGNLTIENSEWDLNKAGIVPNSLNNDDAPPPQNGLCPGSLTQSCTFIQNNRVHDNNNPNVPTQGIAGAAPVGSGIELSGASFNTVRYNQVYNQGAWGIVIHEYPDTETPPPTSSCQGGIQVGPVCDFPARGNLIYGNRLEHNGFFGQPGNADLANEYSSQPKNCFYSNRFTTSDPADIESPAVDGPPCSGFGPGDPALLADLGCASGLFVPCPGYPQRTGVVLLPLTEQQSMPDPCGSVPANPYCRTG